MRSAQPFMRLMKSSSTCCTVLRLNPVNRPLTCCTNLPASNPAWCGCKRGLFEKESPQASLLKSELLLTNFEIRLVLTRLLYPSIAAPVSVEVPKSPLFLSEQFTPTDIMELKTALHLSRAIRRIDGTRIDLATLVDVLSRTFNVRINNPEQCHHTLINRKLRDAFSWHLA